MTPIATLPYVDTLPTTASGSVYDGDCHLLCYGVCPICGSLWVSAVLRIRGGIRGRLPGRPRRYCSDGCRMYAGAMGTLTGLIQHVADRATPDRWRAIRADLWSLGNIRAANRR